MINTFVCSLNCGLVIDPDKIIVHGAKEHNLKNICFAIPKGRLVALTGVSGSGKSSIATDILQKESIRQYLESLGMTTDHVEKAKVDNIIGLAPSIGVTQRVAEFNPRSTVDTKTGLLTILRNVFATLGHQPCTKCKRVVKQPRQDKHNLTVVEVEKKVNSFKKNKKNYFNCPYCDHLLEKLEMAHFSFNTAMGACELCKGIGEIINVNSAQLLNERKTIRDGGVNYWDVSTAKYYENVILAASRYYNFSFDPIIPIQEYTTEQKNFLLYGISFPDFAQAYNDIKAPKKVTEGNFEGLIPHLLNLYKKNPIKNASGGIKKYITYEPCIECKGTRLAKPGRETTVNGKTIIDIIELNLNTLFQWINTLDTLVSKDQVQIFRSFSEALKERTQNLIEIGLNYLTLARTLPSLSIGELQRLRLANLLGNGLTGVLYVLDEPTTGLHAYDSAKLLKTLRMIQKTGNTVLIIEHDMDIVKKTDYIIDMGPGSGSKGGKIVASGTPIDIMTCKESITGKYLAKKLHFEQQLPAYRNDKTLIIRGACEYNLKNIDVTIPIKQFVVLTGVSGSGKSTFLFDIVDKVARKHFYQASEVPGKYNSIEGLDYFNRIITVNQIAIGNSKSSRSNIATYSTLFDLIRKLFASLPEARKCGFGADKFSFNISNERCENCNGDRTVFAFFLPISLTIPIFF